MREQEEQQIATALRGVPLFRLLNEQQARELARVAHRYRYGAGQRIVTQGDTGDSFYVILSGQV
ncbi:MAG TPA: cyclic nucleotide-binding domain-containing protein, partial [Chloroflexota bacterium]|nr:cyclic nucleotide-binding domain-containing protein [Chloroflexota bacterium]